MKIGILTEHRDSFSCRKPFCGPVVSCFIGSADVCTYARCRIIPRSANCGTPFSFPRLTPNAMMFIFLALASLQRMIVFRASVNLHVQLSRPLFQYCPLSQDSKHLLVSLQQLTSIHSPLTQLITEFQNFQFLLSAGNFEFFKKINRHKSDFFE